MNRITTRRELTGCVGSTQFGTETNASSLTAERIHLLRLVCLASWSSPLTAHARLLSSPDTQGPRPRADATSEPHGRPPPSCTELNHGEHLTLYPHLRRAHPTSSSSTAPDVREEGASLCGRKEGVTEWNPVRRDPSPARANGGAAAPSDVRKTLASARLRLGVTGRAWASCGPAPHGSSSSSNRRRPDADVIHPTPIRAAVGRPRPAPRPPSPLGPSTVGHTGRRRIPRARRRPPPRGPAGL